MDVDRDIGAKFAQIMGFAERLEKNINKMMSLSDTLPNEGEKKDFIASTEAIKEEHYALKKRFTNFLHFYQLEEDFTVASSQVEAFVEQERDKNEKLRQLSVKFLSEEDQSLLDFLSKDESFVGFPPLERRTEFSPDIRQLAHRGKEDREEQKLQSLTLPGVSRSRKKTVIKLHKKDSKATTGKILAAIDMGIDLSLLLFQFMIIMRDREAMVDKLRTFKFILGELCQDRDTSITEKMVTVTEMVENENINKTTKAQISVSLEKRLVHEFIDLFLDLLWDLELIASFTAPHNSASAPGGNLQQCDKLLKKVESKLNELKNLFSCDLGPEKLRSLEGKIVAMWEEAKSKYLEEGTEQSSKETSNGEYC